MALLELNGVNIYYDLKGNSQSKETVVFLNGIIASVDSWKLQLPVFEKYDYKILLHDFRGQLLSNKPENPYSFKLHADDLKALLEKLNIDKIHIIAVSYGGIVAQKFMLDYPDMVKSACLINTLSEADNDFVLRVENYIAWAKSCYTPADDNLKKENKQRFFLNTVPIVYSPKYINKMKDNFEKNAKLSENMPDDYYKAAVNLFNNAINNTNFTKELNKITCPVLIIRGDKDAQFCENMTNQLINNIPNCEYIMLPEAGHAAFVEEPDIINTLTLGFIKKHSS